MAPQRPSRHPNSAQPEVSPAWPFPPRGHRQLPGAGEDLARHGDPGTLLDGVFPGEHTALSLWGHGLPGPLLGLSSHRRTPEHVEREAGVHSVTWSYVGPGTKPS